MSVTQAAPTPTGCRLFALQYGNGQRRSLSLPTLAVAVKSDGHREVVGDLIGEGSAPERAVVGETPNLAARIHGRR
jgi:hypothetical protein